MNPKSSDEWAKIFKLHSCIGNKKFAEQVRLIQEDAAQCAISNQKKEQNNKIKN